MIIEFSAPPGSGKTSMAKAASRDGFKLFRFPLQGKEKVFFDAVLMMHPVFLHAFIRSLSVFFTFYRELPLKRKILSSFIASKVKFLRSKKDWYIRDQGYFQFGDWVPKSVNKNSRSLMQALEEIDGTPDAVIFFDVPSEVVCEKLRRRGDAVTWENRALERGYSSLLDRIKDQAKDDIIKYEMCKDGLVAFAIVKITENEEIGGVEYFFPNGQSDYRYQKIYDLVASIKRSWRPLA